MRQADLNRVKRAKDHLKAAITQLKSIMWVHTSEMEDTLINKSREVIVDADRYLDDILNIQDK